MPPGADGKGRIARKVHVAAGGKAVLASNVGSINISGFDESFDELDPFASVPPLPTNYIERPEITEPLVDALLSDAAAVGITALQGMGGIGKTTAAIKLCHHPAVRAAFPDGIIWVTFGRASEISFSQRFEAIAVGLNKRFRSYDENTYRSLLDRRSILVVLDDVWTLEVAEPFLPPPGRCRLLYTSRSRDLAGPLGAETHEVGVLDAVQAKHCLLRWSGRDRTPPAVEVLTGILGECGGLVLALAMVGASLRGQNDNEWLSIHHKLRKAHLRQITFRPSGYAYDCLYASIAVSVEALPAEVRKTYLNLAVLLEDMPAPDAILHALWGGDRDFVHDTARLLLDRSLATRDGDGNLRIHDLQLDYLRSTFPDVGTLDLIRATLLRSLHVFTLSPEQFASQLTARLLPYRDDRTIADLLHRLLSNVDKPCLIPVSASLEPAGGPALRVLEGHTGWVNSVAMSTDAKWAVSGSVDRTVRVWDLNGRDAARVLRGHEGWVNAVAISNGSKQVISGSDDKTIRIWDLETCETRAVLAGHTGSIRAVAVSADGKRVISGSADETVRIWYLEGNRDPLILEGHNGYIQRVAFSENDQRALSSATDGSITVWDLERREPIVVLAGTGQIAWAIDGTSQRSSFLYASERKQLRRLLAGPGAEVNDVALAAVRQRIVYALRDHSLHVQEVINDDVSSGRILRGHREAVLAVAVNAAGTLAVSGSVDQTIRVWDLEKESPLLIHRGHSGPVRSLALSADGSRVISGSTDRFIGVWDFLGEAPTRFFEGHASWINGVDVSSGGDVAISGSNDKSVLIWNIETDESRCFDNRSGAVRAVAVSANGKRAVWIEAGDALCIADLQAATKPRVMKSSTKDMCALALSADGTRAITSSNKGLVDVWDLDCELLENTLRVQAGWVNAVALSADGKRAVLASADDTVRLWNLTHRSLPVILGKHADFVSAVAFSDDGRYVISVSRDTTMRVWEVSTQRCLCTFTCDTSLWSCAWAKDRIVAGDAGGQVHSFRWLEH